MSNSRFNTNIEFIETKKGKGVYTSVDIPANTTILEFKGDVLTKETLNCESKYYLQIGKDKFIGPSGDVDDYVCHSCNPNCSLYIVGSRAFLTSIYFIAKNTELTFDYSTSSTNSLDEWSIDCKCGFFKCRKKISGYQYLDSETKEKYEKLGIVPRYLTGK